jgi:hypothetical protein
MAEHLCVYTALFGRYEDLLPQPIAAESEFDFICFTDDPELESDIWRIELVEPPLRSDPARSSRYPKICAHRFLDGYDTSLYIDNSVLLTRPAEEIVEMLLPDRGAAFGAVAHSFRDTVEDEFLAVMDAGFDSERVCLEQLAHYRLHYPDVLALRPVAGGVLARRHRQPDVIDAMERWWYHVLRYSRRDQLSLLVALFDSSVSPVLVELDLQSNPYWRWPAGTGRDPDAQSVVRV